MRGLGGFVLLAGIGVGLFVYFPAPVDRDTTLAQATRAVAARAVPSENSETSVAATTTTTAPSVARFSPAVTLDPASSKPRVAAAAPTAPAVTPAAKVEPIASWQTSVMPTAGGPSGSLEPTDPESRYKLVVDIQQELKRVGCYWGRVNGAWNANTRYAMQEFTTRANAALPVDKPDYLLLTLLKSHNGRSCGATEATVAEQPRGRGESVAGATPEVLPWKANPTQQPATRLYTPLPTSVVSTEPLPGRMAIGAPKEFPPAAQAPLIPGTPGTAPAQRGVATAALEPDAGPAASPPPAAVAPRPPRQVKKKSGSWRRPAQGTPRYNLMLSLGGIY
jgi:hypothetical protein